MNTRDISIQISIQHARHKIKYKDIDFIASHSQIRQIGNPLYQ